MNVTYSCKVYNRTFDAIGYIDEVGCRILHTAADLFYYDFGYICMGPLGLIIIISIFGRLKGHYRWFILNQAVWDLFTSHFYCCANFALTNNWVKPAPACFYLPTPDATINRIGNMFISRIIMYNSYSALLLLAGSRFMALYYQHTYAKLIKGRNILYTIILFTLFTILFDIYPWISFFNNSRLASIGDECALQKNLTRTICINDLKVYQNDFLYNFSTTLSLGFELLQYFKATVFLFLSVIAAILIILKIAKSVIFQLKQDRKDFSSTVRIAVVITLQCVINSFGVFLELFNKFIPRSIEIFKLKIVTARNFNAGRNYTDYLDLRLPIWLDGSMGLSSDNCRFMIIQFRILIEAFVILFIMTGYREAIMDFIKFIYTMIMQPMKRLKNLKLNKTEVSHPSLF